MIGHYIRDNFHWCVIWGIILQCLGGLIPLAPSRPLLTVLGWLMLAAGTLLMLVGFAFYAKAKGRSPAWSLLSLASILGWIVLISLTAKPSPSVSGDNLTGRR
ncbi:MAG: hypothetical protein A2Y76_13970 [Planctomycetes bacterium RBG_13_60_9]|nr:MAG: hypothetical protein A2Y76_13970 [Planctomycetes bacterium RBG_13_60_9]